MNNTVAEFIKQGWDPAQAAILAETQKGVAVDARQEEKIDAARLPLLRLVEGYEAKWPEIHYARAELSGMDGRIQRGRATTSLRQRDANL